MSRKTGKTFFVFLILISVPLFADDVQVEALISSEEIGLNDVLVYTLNITCGFSAEPSQIKFPDFQGFKRISQSESSKMNIMIGSGQTFTKVKTYEIQLLPNRTGQIEIKPATVVVRGKVYQTSPLKVNVLSASKSTGSRVQRAPLGRGFQFPFDIDELPFDTKISDEDIILQSVVDKKSVFAGEEFIYSLYLLSAISIYDIEQLSIPKFEGCWSEEIYSPKKFTSEQKRVGSRVYNVYLLKRKAVFPNEPGIYEIEPANIILNVVAGFNQRRIVRQSTPLKIEVKALPEKDMPVDFPVYNVGDYRVSYSISPQRQSMDKPFTLNIVVEGKGNINAFSIPRLKDNPDLKIYDPVIKTELDADNRVYRGKKIYEYLIFSRRVGRVSLPSFEINYFRPETSTYERVYISGLSIDVTDAEGSNGIVSRRSNSGGTESVRTIRFVDRTGNRFSGLNKQSFLVSTLVLPLLFLLVRIFDFAKLLYVYLGFDSEIMRRKRRLKKIVAESERLFRDLDREGFIESIYSALCEIFFMKYNVVLSGMTRERLREIMVLKNIKDDLIGDIEEILDTYEFVRFSSSSSYQMDLGRLRDRFQRIMREIGE